jgi:hypothetical protein
MSCLRVAVQTRNLDIIDGMQAVGDDELMHSR